MNFTYTIVVKTLLVTGIIIFAGTPLLAGTITLAQLASAPTLDGSDSDWKGTLPTSIQLNKSSKNVTVDTHSASIKAGVFGD